LLTGGVFHVSARREQEPRRRRRPASARPGFFNLGCCCNPPELCSPTPQSGLGNLQFGVSGPWSAGDFDGNPFALDAGTVAILAGGFGAVLVDPDTRVLHCGGCRTGSGQPELDAWRFSNYTRVLGNLRLGGTLEAIAWHGPGGSGKATFTRTGPSGGTLSVTGGAPAALTNPVLGGAFLSCALECYLQVDNPPAAEGAQTHVRLVARGQLGGFGPIVTVNGPWSAPYCTIFYGTFLAPHCTEDGAAFNYSAIVRVLPELCLPGFGGGHPTLTDGVVVSQVSLCGALQV